VTFCKYSHYENKYSNHESCWTEGELFVEIKIIIGKSQYKGQGRTFWTRGVALS
jgi:hypothetical protein